MPTRPDTDAIIAAISDLALDIAAHCPDCADKATELVSLVRQLESAGLDRGAIKDTLDSEVVDTDMSDLRARSVAEAVAKRARDDD